MSRRVDILFCHCSYADIIPDETRNSVVAELKNRRGVFATADLCGLAVQNNAILHEMATNPNLCVIACYPRAVRWLFHRAGIELSSTITIFNMRIQAPEVILASLPPESADAADSVWAIDKTDPWNPWYPVIDYSRCADCRQCMDFCLFGVYATGKDRAVEVLKPAGCKTGCPACARVCSRAAIIFPKYSHSPINGDEVTDENWKTCQSMQDQVSGVNLKDLLAKRRAMKTKSLLDREKPLESNS
jgi:Pyruvate/2-oxoacid:ferredoxin oxidoreductase delta subunit